MPNCGVTSRDAWSGSTLLAPGACAFACAAAGTSRRRWKATAIITSMLKSRSDHLPSASSTHNSCSHRRGGRREAGAHQQASMSSSFT